MTQNAMIVHTLMGVHRVAICKEIMQFSCLYGAFVLSRLPLLDLVAIPASFACDGRCLAFLATRLVDPSCDRALARVDCAHFERR